jgi:long-chain-fatty-acyl-CoA reductase
MQHHLPIVVCGERMETSDEYVSFEYLDGTCITVPSPPSGTASRIIESPRKALRDMSVDDLTLFFAEVGRRWADPENEWRRLALELGPRVTGYADYVIRGDVEYLARTLERAKQYDFIATDLGDPHLLDEWRPSRAVYRRCWPRGLVVHIMVGNVPLAGLFAFYRSLITKNITVAKLPSRDILSALCFANCIVDVDPGHPASKALSTLYWEPRSDFERELIASADVVSAWGRGDTVEAVKRSLRAGTEFVEFGPKRSFAIVTRDVLDVADLVKRLALDVVMYDQEACFSCQEIYCQTDPDELGEALADSLDRWEQVVRRREFSVDQHAHIQRARAEAAARGWTVHRSPRTEWTVTVTDGPVSLTEHPLGRFVYVHPIGEVAEVLPHVDRNVQTVSIAPWHEDTTLSDLFTAAGVDRVVPPGRMSRYRPGLSHDGFYPMARMVRWVAMERDGSFKYQYAGAASAEAETRRYGLIDNVSSRVT